MKLSETETIALLSAALERIASPKSFWLSEDTAEEMRQCASRTLDAIHNAEREEIGQ